jgi:phosphorylcholine metabolism protein LicD
MHSGWNSPTSKVIRSGRMPTHKLYIDIKSIFPLKKLTFEGKEFYVPNNSNEYLNILYANDYMTLPPEDKRHTHASSIEIYDQSK